MYTPGSNLTFGLQLLVRGPEQDLVHVYVLGLADGEGNCPRERFGRNRDLSIKPLDSFGGAGSVTLLGGSVAIAPGEMTVVRML
jgi:hypothetical protein